MPRPTVDKVLAMIGSGAGDDVSVSANETSRKEQAFFQMAEEKRAWSQGEMRRNGDGVGGGGGGLVCLVVVGKMSLSVAGAMVPWSGILSCLLLPT